MSSTQLARPICSFVLCFLAVFALGTRPAHAQAYPSKTIEWISHTSAGTSK
jgi:hypothetical protein